MKKTQPAIAFLAASYWVLCGFGSARAVDSVDPGGATPVPAGQLPADVPFPANGTTLRVSINKLVGFSSTEAQKAERARQVAETVVNSAELREFVLTYNYNGTGTFVQNNGLNNEQIYALMMSGREDLFPTVDHEVDLELEIYTSGFFGRNVVGYTNPDTTRIWMNRRFYGGFTPGDIAGNMIHEWLHKIGFDHDFNSTARRPYSVPYAIGDKVVEIAEKMGLN